MFAEIEQDVAAYCNSDAGYLKLLENLLRESRMEDSPEFAAFVVELKRYVAAKRKYEIWKRTGRFPDGGKNYAHYGSLAVDAARENKELLRAALAEKWGHEAVNAAQLELGRRLNAIGALHSLNTE